MPETSGPGYRRLLAPSILIVDDEPDVRELIKDVLESSGCEVLTAGGGREAVQSLKDNKVDMLIVDLVMPEQEGIETIGIAQRSSPALKILAISGSDPLYLRMARILGAQDTLQKPFTVDALLTKVKDLLQSQPEGPTVGQPGA